MSAELLVALLGLFVSCLFNVVLYIAMYHSRKLRRMHETRSNYWMERYISLTEIAADRDSKDQNAVAPASILITAGL